MKVKGGHRGGGKVYFDLGKNAPPVTADLISFDYETTTVDWAKASSWSSTNYPTRPNPALTAAAVHKMMREIALLYGIPSSYLYGGTNQSQSREEDEPMPRMPGRASQCLLPADNPLVPPGKVAFTKGAGTYNARLRLKAMGGRWQGNLLGGVWVLPEEVMHEAAQQIRLGAKSSVELPVGDDPATETVEKITCYVCGTRYLPWEFAKLTGSSVGEWFCGCTTRQEGAKPRTAQVRR